MPIKVIVTPGFDHMSEKAAEIVKKIIAESLDNKKGFIPGLATGNSPTGLYRHLARAANAGEFDPSRIRSFNLDEYVGLSGPPFSIFSLIYRLVDFVRQGSISLQYVILVLLYSLLLY